MAYEVLSGVEGLFWRCLLEALLEVLFCYFEVFVQFKVGFASEVGVGSWPQLLQLRDTGGPRERKVVFWPFCRARAVEVALKRSVSVGLRRRVVS
jgi:hypothetical protein